MAENKRGRCKEHMRHSNRPVYKIPAARRQNVSERYPWSANFSLHAWLLERSQFWVRGWCFDRLRCDSDSIQFTLPCSNSDKQFCHNKDEFLSTDCGAFTDAEFTMRQCEWQRALTFHRRQKYCMYARFIKEDDNNFSVMSRVVVGQTLKLLQRSMKKRMMCYFLVRPQQPLRALFWCCRLWWNINLRKKHFVTCLQWLKLTAPDSTNGIRKSQKLFEFVSQAKEKNVKYFFCSYSNA